MYASRYNKAKQHKPRCSTVVQQDALRATQRRALLALIFVLNLTALCAPAAQAQELVTTIANWRFEQGAQFLADSSGNGHTLVSNGATHIPQQDPAVMDASGGTGSAHFDGNDVVFTAANLDFLTLVTQSHLRILWSQRNQIVAVPPSPAVSRRIVFEQTPNFASFQGAFALAVNSDLPGTTDRNTQGFLALTGNLGRISALFPVAVGGVPGTWQRFRADINLNPLNGVQFILQVFDANGVLVSSTNELQAAPTSFTSNIFFIGAQGTDATLGFTGNIDEFVVQNVTTNPPPVTSPVTSPITSPITSPVTAVNSLVSGVTLQGGSGANGILIDPKGVLRLQSLGNATAPLMRRRIAEARARLNPDVAQASKLRKVSLNRLEAAVREQLDHGSPPTEDMQYLAGLTRVRYVFYYPETKDIVLAGPAEGWAVGLANRVCGIESGRPVLQLQDLLVALRAFAPGERGAPVILCSIDPTPEGLVRMQEFLRNVGSHATPDDTEGIVTGLRTSLGMQNVRVGGMAANTHFAQVLLECDYRMKLIGIGAEKPPVKIVSFVDRASPSSSRSALQRWFFIPDYSCARIAADKLGMELVGDGVKLVSEDQIVNKDGSRAATGKGNKASDLFTKTFTQRYAELAARVPVFAELRNLIDLSIVAAFIHEEDFYARADWRAATFNDERALAVGTYNTPLQVETVCTAVWKGNRLMTPVGGGVTIHPRTALSAGNAQHDEDGKISELRESIELEQLPAGRWWWD